MVRHRLRPLTRDDPPPECFTIEEFCAAYRVSRSNYYKLQAAGLGPQEVRLGARVLIHKTSAQHWLAAREARKAGR